MHEELSWPILMVSEWAEWVKILWGFTKFLKNKKVLFLKEILFRPSLKIGQDSSSCIQQMALSCPNFQRRLCFNYHKWRFDINICMKIFLVTYPLPPGRVYYQMNEEKIARRLTLFHYQCHNIEQKCAWHAYLIQ